MNVEARVSGFEHPISGNQETFRAIIKAMARPGQLVKINSKVNIPDILNPAAAATCLTLLADETPLWTDLSWNVSAVNWFQFQCGCSIVTEPCMARFALITQPAAMPPLDHFRIGDEAHPETAATLIVQVERFNAHHGKILSGPGMKTTTLFAPEGIPPKFWEQWQLLIDLNPLGVDIFFTCNDILAALPRSTRVMNTDVQGDRRKSDSGPNPLWGG